MVPRPDHSLTREQQFDIWWRWTDRPTIKSLAAEYNTTEEVIRHIISLPRIP
jgi:hypothetical protein